VAEVRTYYDVTYLGLALLDDVPMVLGLRRGTRKNRRLWGKADGDFEAEPLLWSAQRSQEPAEPAPAGRLVGSGIAKTALPTPELAEKGMRPTTFSTRTRHLQSWVASL
jgi:hypothetical protein